MERLGEAFIACEAADLRKEAFARIAELNRVRCRQQASEVALANAVMSDDGGPPIEQRDEIQASQ